MKTSDEQIFEIADDMDDLASLLRANKQHLPTWRLIIKDRLDSLFAKIDQTTLRKGNIE